MDKRTPLWRISLAVWGPVVGLLAVLAAIYGCVWIVSYEVAKNKDADNKAVCAKAEQGLTSWNNCHNGSYIARNKLGFPTYTPGATGL